MRKYNITVHVLFWIIIIFILSAAALLLFLRNNGFNPVTLFLKNDELQEEEKIIVREVTEVEKEVDWFYFVASGYSANDTEQGTDNITAIGGEVREGIIAVDPDVIPLGTEVEIKNMGVFVAEDTGGKIKGNKIDIYFKSKEEAEVFGIKGVWIRIKSGSVNTKLAYLYGDIPLYGKSFTDENLSAYENRYHIFNGDKELSNN
jgi:3D (Asp-Asp-Asp) domain-containing protein